MKSRQINNKTYQEISGFYKVVRVEPKFGFGGEPYEEFTLQQWDQTFKVSNYETSCIEADCLKLDAIVFVRGQLYTSKHHNDLQPAVIAPVYNDLDVPIRSLPVSNPYSCPDVYAVNEMFNMIDSLGFKPFQTAVSQIFMQDDLMERFIHFPASQMNHHSEKGGLVRHSVAVANLVRCMIEQNDPMMPGTMKETAMVAGLLHDIGKTQTYTETGYDEQKSRLIYHDDLTLELCSPGLKYLDKECPEVADTLRHIWTATCYGSKYGNESKTVLVEYVKYADRLNSASDFQASTSRNYQMKGMAKLPNGSRLWVPISREDDFHSKVFNESFSVEVDYV